MDTRTPSTTDLTDAQRIDRLRLIRSDNVGPRGIIEQTPPGSESDPGDNLTRRIQRLFPLGYDTRGDSHAILA
jgi:hypothetical protein